MINLVDIVAILFILVYVVMGWRRGLAAEIGHLAGAALAFWIGLRYHERLAAWMTGHTRMEGAPATVVAYVAVVLAIILASMILSLVLSKLMELAIPEGANKVWGGMAGLVKGSLYAAMILLAVNLWPHEYLNRHFGEESVLGAFVMRWVPVVREEMEARGVTEHVREQVGASREKVQQVLESEEAQREAGRVRRWFSKSE